MPDETTDRLARIETKLDILLTNRDDHEERIRGLEQWKWRAGGIAFGISGVVSFLVSIIGKV